MRFGLLVVLMLASSISLVPMALTAAGLNHGIGCLHAAGVGSGEAPTSDVLRSEAYRACADEYGVVPWGVGPAMPAALAVLACGLFFVLPWWKARRSRVVPLEMLDHDGQILLHLSRLAQMTGIKRMPRIVVDPFAPFATSTGAAVFGRTGRPTMCLHGGLLARRAAAPEDFEAVLLHELAHIRNRDVTLTYATVALWRTFIAVVLLPYAVGFGVLLFNSYTPETPPYEVDLAAWRAIALPVFMMVIVYLASSDVLRSRELHADLTAARWGAHPRVWDFTESRPRRRWILNAPVGHARPRPAHAPSCQSNGLPSLVRWATLARSPGSTHAGAASAFAGIGHSWVAVPDVGDANRVRFPWVGQEA
ncbi:M48 family metalloprotease [Streptomyces anulatus]